MGSSDEEGNMRNTIGEEDLSDEDDLEDDLDEEEEEEEEDEGEMSKKRRKTEPLDARIFLEEEAEVSSDDDDDDEEDDEMEADWAEHKAVTESRSDYRQAFRRDLDLDDQSVEEIAKSFEERARRKAHLMDSEDGIERPEIRQQSALPSVKDPKLWMIKCKVGKERITVISIMQKFLNKQNDPDKLLIKSAVCPEHLKGYVYIEADKESHVKSAIKGMRNLFEWSAKLVPIKEMTEVLAVTKKTAALKRGDYVRVIRGLYKGDLAEVYEADEARGRVTVKVIPRVDFSMKAMQPEEKDPEKKKKKIRPPQRFFNGEEMSNGPLQRQVERKRDDKTMETYYIFGGNKYKEGYLVKTMNLKSLDTINVSPSLDELEKFKEHPTDKMDEGPESLISGNLPPKRKSQLVKGDTVRVISGDLKNLIGIVDSVDDKDNVTILPKHDELKDLLTFRSSQLLKYFKTGDHVKVVSGRYEGESGLIVRVEDNAVVIFSDLSVKEIKVLADDIQEASEVTSGKVQLGGYELHDLVSLGQNVGVIVKIERDSFRVLDNNGNVQTISLQEIGNKKIIRDASSFDAFQTPVGVGDIVKVTDGPHKGKQGTVKHLFKYFAFLHSKEMMDNSGIFVARTGNCAVLGGNRTKGAGSAGMVPRSPARIPGSPAHLGLKSPARGTAPMRGRVDHIHSNIRKRDTGLIGKQVRVRSGQWKGYLGTVKDCTDTTARVELHTNCKTVSIALESLEAKEATADPRMAFNAMATPMRDYPTTPMRPSTPVWDPSRVTATPTWEPRYEPFTPSNETWSTTPGSSYQPPSSSYNSPYSPTTTYDSTPGDYNPSTPGYGTPGSAYTPEPSPGITPSYSPAFQQPATPATPGVAPATPGTPYESHSEEYGQDSNWVMPDIQVKVSSSTFRNGAYAGKIGSLRSVNGSNCEVHFGNEKITIPADALEPHFESTKGIKVKIVKGEFRGEKGTLLAIDGPEAIVKMESDLDTKILDISYLAKVV